MSSRFPLPDPSDIEYARGSGARLREHQRPLRPLEWAVLAHLAIFSIGTTWAFGGGADWVRPVIAWWGSLGLLLTLTAIRDRSAWREGWMKPLVWLAPLAVVNVLVIAGCLNPNFRELPYENETMLLQTNVGNHLPSSARPALALHALWLFDAIWISCLNLALVVRQRRAVRGLLFLLTANALVLAVFGTVQKLSHAKGLYFDAVPSPQIAFFSTFVYHNHWGSFTVLSLAACLGLIWHYARHADVRGFFHTPAFAGVISLFFMAATVPLSTSRSCTVLVVVLLCAAVLHWLVRLVQKRRRFREGVWLPFLSTFAALGIGAAGVWFVAQDSITVRVAKTREQVTEIRTRGDTGSRGELYRNTWRMAQARPWFGWGMASYPHVFTLYNTQKSIDKFPVFYRDAHSDWLQALAEHGFIGTAFLGLCGLIPLLGLRRRQLTPVPGYLLGGCTIILLYAWVEFPFGNVAVVLTWWLCFFSAVHYARLHGREAPSPTKSAPSSA
jgi:O-antigen ligase